MFSHLNLTAGYVSFGRFRLFISVGFVVFQIFRYFKKKKKSGVFDLSFKII